MTIIPGWGLCSPSPASKAHGTLRATRTRSTERSPVNPTQRETALWGRPGWVGAESKKTTTPG